MAPVLDLPGRAPSSYARQRTVTPRTRGQGTAFGELAVVPRRRRSQALSGGEDGVVLGACAGQLMARGDQGGVDVAGAG